MLFEHGPARQYAARRRSGHRDVCYAVGAHPFRDPPVMSKSPIGYYGEFGGRFVAETLIPLGKARAGLDTIVWQAFQTEWRGLLATYVGRPTPLGEAKRGTASTPVAKRSGAFGSNGRISAIPERTRSTMRWAKCCSRRRWARRASSPRRAPDSTASPPATACALFGLPCEVFMGAEDVRRQAPNVGRMKLLGARVVPVESGSRTLKDSMNEALRDWVTNVRTTHYCIGSAAGPHPYPELVATLQAVIGEEARAPGCSRHKGRCRTRSSHASESGSECHLFPRLFMSDPSVAFFGVEAAGDGVHTPRHAATLSAGRIGVLHGSKSYVLCDDGGQITEAHSISAGLDYPGVGPEHSWLKVTGRAHYVSATDDEALAAVKLVACSEGIVPALETAHAFARVGDIARKLAATRGRPVTLVVGLSGRGDKDLSTLLERLT